MYSSPLRRLGAALCLLAGATLGSPADAYDTVNGVFTASNGLAGPWRMHVPSARSSSRPFGLLMFFHSDGAIGRHAQDADMFRELAFSRNLAVAALSVPAPGNPYPSSSADQCWWAPRAESNARYVEEWLEEEVIARYGKNFDAARVVTAGVSGGADFAVSLNAHLDFRFEGGAVGLCGGDIPRRDGGSCVSEPGPKRGKPLPGAGDVPKRVRRRFVIGLDTTPEDPFRTLILGARDYYREELDLHVRYSDRRGTGHCEFQDSIRSLVERRLDEAVLGPGCFSMELGAIADALLDDVPLRVAERAIPWDDPKRQKLLDRIRKKLDAIAALRAAIPDRAGVCGRQAPCRDLGLDEIVSEIEFHLGKLKKKKVPKALSRATEAWLREQLTQENAASHRRKKDALKLIPTSPQTCQF